MPSFMALHAAKPTTAITPVTSTGTAIKTLIQVTAASNSPIRVWKWGVSFDGTGTSPIQCELLTTGTVAGGTPTSFTPYQYDFGGLTSNTSACGFAPSTEGSITTTRIGDLQQILPGNFFQNEFSLGREFWVSGGDVVRIRIDNTGGTAVNYQAFLIWEE